MCPAVHLKIVRTSLVWQNASTVLPNRSNWFKDGVLGWVLWLTCLISALQMKKQAGLCKFETRLVYIVSLRPAGTTERLPQKNNNKSKKFKWCVYANWNPVLYHVENITLHTYLRMCLFFLPKCEQNQSWANRYKKETT